MKLASARGLISAFFVALFVGTVTLGGQAPVAPRWFKGNTHAHTVNSDGDSTPVEVARWYREQHYQFLVLTDHNFVTEVDVLNALVGAEDRFLVIPGEEISDRAGDKPVHVNALGNSTLVRPQGGTRPGETLQRDVDAARAAGGLAQVNHPNFGWALTPADVREAAAAELVEIFNGHPQVNNLGGGGAPAAEALWDDLLTAGRMVFGVASDDLHELKRPGVRQAAGPGRGWVMVRAKQLRRADILGALSRGDFYATTGVELRDVQASSRELTVSIREQDGARYRVRFTGKAGRLLKEVEANPAVYSFTGDVGYVRARVIDSNGLVAWTQPVPITPGPGSRDDDDR